MTATKTFTGNLVLGDDDPLRVDLSIDVAEIRIAAGAVEIGTWLLTECVIQSEGDDLYRMEVDGDVLFFRPHDVEAFASVIPHLGLATLADALLRPGEQAESEVAEAGGAFLEAGEGPEIDPGAFDFLQESFESIEILPSTSDHESSELIDPGPTYDLSTAFDPDLGPTSEQSALETPEGFETAFEAEDTAQQMVVAFDPPTEPELVPSDDAPDSVMAETPSGEPQNSEERSADDFEETAAAVVAISATPSLIDRINQMAETDDDSSSLPGFGRRLERRRVAKASKVGSAEDLESIGGADVEPAGFATTDTASETVPDVEGAPSETASLAAAVAALRGQFDDDDPETVVDEILASQRSLRSSRAVKSNLSRNLKKAALVVGVAAVVGGMVMGAFLLVRLVVSRPSPEPTAVSTVSPTVATPATPTTLPETETTIVPEPSEPTGFAITSPEFFRRWNETAGGIDPRLILPPLLPGSFEAQLTDFIAANGTVGENGSVTLIELVIDPSGSEDQLGIQALGLLIATVDPNLDGPDRRALLASLGLDVRNPILQGVNGLTTHNGVTYTLVFSSEEVLLHFKAVG